MRLHLLFVLVAALAGLALTADGEAAPEPLVGASLYERAAPAIAYIETPIASGSGILFEGGYLLTDAHVVSPYDVVRVRFPDGRTLRDVPVVAVDMLADLAVIRVGEVPDVQPLTFGDPTRLEVGSDVFLIGYPAERQPNPSPTFSRGLLSRVRQGGPLDLQFAQTDATTAPGASGGAMLSASGEVVGIIQLRYPATNFALALSGAQAIERMRAQLGGIPGELGSRQYSAITSTMVGQDTVRLASRYDQQAYVIRSLVEVEVSVRATSPSALLTVYDAAGDRVARSSDETARLSFRAQPRHPYMLVAGGASGETYEVLSDYPMLRIPDPDDRRALTVGGALFGNLDYYGDIDAYTLDLREGQTVTVTAESTLLDSVLFVSRADSTSGPVLDSTSTTSERGLLGNDAVLAFMAATDRRYVVGVTDFSLFGSTRQGAYRLSVHLSRPARTTKGYGAITSGDVPGTNPAAFVFGGGTDDDLVAATGCSRAALRIWASRPDGQIVPFVPGASVSQVNAAWDALFPFGVPAGIALLGQCPRER